MNKQHRSVPRRRSWVLLSALGLALAMSPVVAERIDTTRIFAYLNSTYMDSEQFCVPADVILEFDAMFLKAGLLNARCYLHMHYPVCEKG